MALARPDPVQWGSQDRSQILLSHLILSALSIAGVHPIVKSTFGGMLTTIRNNAQCARRIGTNARFYQLMVFALADDFAGLACGLFGSFNRGVPNFATNPSPLNS
jgi:ABC-type branched-subunit amino acid transport system permease subunit